MSGQRHTHVHVHEVDTDRILHAIGELASGQAQQLAQGAQIMATLESLQAQITEVRTTVGTIGPSLQNISADIERIRGTLVGGLTAEQGEAVAAELSTLQEQVTAVATAASALAAANPEPEAPAPPSA